MTTTLASERAPLPAADVTHSRGEQHLPVGVLEALVDADVLILAPVHQRFFLVHVLLLQVGEALEALVQLLLFRQSLPRDRCNKTTRRVTDRRTAHSASVHD